MGTIKKPSFCLFSWEGFRLLILIIIPFFLK